jgi:CRP-like cAMP-binding protein
MNNEHPLVQRFRNFGALPAEDEARLRALANNHPQTKAARRDLIREGDHPRAVFLILSGWACRYKVLEDGRRQLLQFLIPGDLCDVHNVVLREMDHSIGAVTEVRFSEISHCSIEELERASPHLRHALWWHSMTAIAMQREWTTNIGQRSALERLSHLFCELFLRLRSVGLTEDRSCDMPITQTDLGDATGLTSVHVNRTIQQLRETGLIVLQSRRLTIPDFGALQKSALFSDNYLHLGSRGPRRPSSVSNAPWLN